MDTKSTTKISQANKRAEKLPDPKILFRWLMGLAALVVLIVSFYIPLVAFIFLVLITTYLLGYFKIFTLVEKILLSVLCVMTLNISLYSVTSVFGISVPVWKSSFILLVLVSLLALWIRRSAWHGVVPPRSFKGKIDQSDIVSVLASALTFCLLLVPIVNQSGAYIAQFLSYGEDNASHYAITRYLYEEGEFSYLHTDEDTGLMKTLEVYPQGFHLNSSIFVAFLHDLIPSEAAFVKVYGVVIAGIYSFFIFWFIKLCTSFTRRSSTIVVASFLPAMVILCALSIFIPLLSRGFQAHIFSYLYVTAIIFLLVKYRQKLPQKPKPFSFLVLCLFLLIGISASWWLLAPLICVLLTYFIYQNNIHKTLLRDIIRYLAPLSLIVFCIMYPVVTSALLSGKNDPLSEQGGVDKIPYTIFIYIMAPVLLFFVLKAYKAKGMAIILIALALSILFTALIGIYHLTSVGHLEYYYFKSLYTVLLIGVVLFFIGSIYIANKLYNRIKSPYNISIPVLVIVITIAISIASNLVYIKVYMHNWYPNSVEISDMEPLYTNTTDHSDDIIYIGDCNNGSDYLSNRWAGARLLSENRDRELISSATILQEYKDINKYVKRHVDKTENILLIIDTRCANRFPILKELEKNPDVTIQYTHTKNQVE